MSFNVQNLFSQTSNAMTPLATEFFPSLTGALSGLSGTGGASSLGGMGLLGQHPGFAAAMFGLEFAAPLLQKLLDSLPNLGKQEQAADGGVGNKPGGCGAQDTQAEISRILNSNLSLEEKIILIAGLVSDSLNGQLEDQLKEQGKLAQNMNNSAAGSQQGAKFQNVENQIQLLMQRLNRMQTLASNLMQAVHTTQRTVLSNIRV